MAVNVLSLFDGISCGRMAIEKIGIKVDNYYASELDKYACAVSAHNYPDTIALGDVTKWREWDLPKIDLLIGGSPCQGFSFAGKQLAFDDPRSKLFFEFVDILKEVKPRYFLLENVRMKKEFQDIISQYLGVEPVMINSSLVSAQNRKRYYWTNIPGITQPQDKGIMLKDIVHEKCDGHLSDKEVGYMLRGSDKWQQAGNCRLERYSQYDDRKSFTVTANIHKGVPYNCFYQVLNEYVVPFDKTLQILDKEIERGKVGFFRKDSQANRVYYIHDKAVTLCGASGGGAAKMGQYLFGCITPDRINKRQNGQRFSEGKKFYTLTAQDRHGVLIEGYIRKLTPIECERLQTVPENYTLKGLDTHFQMCHSNGNENYSKKGELCRESVKSMDVISPSQARKLNCAISTILDSLEMDQLNLKENLSIKTKSVSSKDVKEKNKLSVGIALNTTRLGRESKLQKKESVKFVIERSDTQDGEDCVFVMRLLKQDGEILSELKKMEIESTNHTGIMEENIIKPKMVDGCIELLQKKFLEENCGKEKLYITLILINLIIAKAIFLSVKVTHPTYLSIDSLNLLQGNLLEMELSSLKMENIIEMSNSSRYKQLGNGWTVDVISHILSHIPKNQ